MNVGEITLFYELLLPFQTIIYCFWASLSLFFLSILYMPANKGGILYPGIFQGVR